LTERSKHFFLVFHCFNLANFSLVFPFLLFGRQRVATDKAARRKFAALQTGAPDHARFSRGGVAICHRERAALTASRTI
jgi:hypothetical protein